ncbi:MAG: 16S rRNA (cytidine(1402)-2'-O)-methyltransferase [Sandaracinaceae bacterium]|nr:16S rRNA (cytidine(1402)-2'-O)-methyltransferase [Sandaracinaceae bacterium]
MSDTAAQPSGILYVVGTPIGNLEDITLRALRILREVDAILAEDTRHTKKLCERHTIGTRLRAYHAHSNDSLTEKIVGELKAGARLALVSDAGSPLISDPGASLVAACVAAGVRVESIPGASAVISAVTVAGLRSDSFRFVGFLPRSGSSRKEALEHIRRDTITTVFFESPQRLLATLRDLEALLGPARRIAVCRELTKAYEEVVRGIPAEVAAHFADGARGEIAIVVEGLDESEALYAAKPVIDDKAIVQRIHSLAAEGTSKRDIAKMFVDEYALSKNDAYARVLGALDER